MHIKTLNYQAVRLTLAAATLSFCSSLNASVIFTSLNGPQGAGYVVNGANAPTFPESVAASFTGASTFILTNAAVEVLALPGQDPTFNAAIYTDNSGLPGTIITSIGSNLVAPSSSGEVSVSTPSVTLTGGTQYWLVLTPAEANTGVSWGDTATVTSGLSHTADTTGTSGWGFSASEPVEFEIDGAIVPAIPEPSTLLLALPALGAFFFARRRSA
jgi:hypothetical protein